MSLGKLPGIKGLVSTSHGKRRFKSDLSVDMISPPLGDFRHTMHVGRGGDVFGDTSFLSNHGGPGNEEEAPDSPSGSSKTARFFSRTLRHVRRTPGQPRGGSRDLSSPPPPISPIIKNAISLPQLDVDSPNGCLQRVLFPSSPSCPEGSAYSYGLQSGFVTLPRFSRSDRQLQDGSGTYSPEFRRGSLPDSGGFSLTRSDSMTSFTIDLGPSLMSEVFGVIDSPNYSQKANYSWGEEEEEEQEEETSSTPEPMVDSPMTHSASASMVGSPLREGVNSRGSSGDPGWGAEEEEEEEEEEDAAHNVVMMSPSRLEPGMEPERFQRAADVLARHYGGGGFLKGQQQAADGGDHPHDTDSCTRLQRRAPYAFPEEEDEIKV
ncbi:cdc42 effector protein 1-like [Megalops cyprinoides]|uniref:cdc42 effector protein 1-like n=1 Tax=Megalops cyprinoides TaxID=118141 RepID=UPI001863DF96|nr:cdc42 effector protein 1-like [Megalops cyprinoides]